MTSVKPAKCDQSGYSCQLVIVHGSRTYLAVFHAAKEENFNQCQDGIHAIFVDNVKRSQMTMTKGFTRFTTLALVSSNKVVLLARICRVTIANQNKPIDQSCHVRKHGNKDGEQTKAAMTSPASGSRGSKQMTSSARASWKLQMHQGPDLQDVSKR